MISALQEVSGTLILILVFVIAAHIKGGRA